LASFSFYPSSLLYFKLVRNPYELPLVGFIFYILIKKRRVAKLIAVDKNFFISKIEQNRTNK